jgi:hypothetical protein
MRFFEGKQCKVRILADSINHLGNRLLTYEAEYPRIIHAEFMTHRMLARNAASSRAIPAAKMREQLTAAPVRFGKNVGGMQDAGEWREPIWNPRDGIWMFPEEAWEAAKEDAIMWSSAFAEAGYHKQVFNRLTEASQKIKIVTTATEWDNFFWLRKHEAADPTIAELAQLMWDAREDSRPMLLQPGEWHLPYIKTIRMDKLHYCLEEDGVLQFPSLDLEDAIKVSCARCAAVSFRNVDYGVEKSREVYERLVGDQRKHASAFEHCATPMKTTKFVTWADSDLDKNINVPSLPYTWEDGISHMDRYSRLWSGNLQGFIQYRKLIPGENYVAEAV